MIKKLTGCLTLLGLALFLALGLKTPLAHASNTNLISDNVFDNTNSMTAGQIDAWLNNNFPNSCISTNNGFTAPDPTGYAPVSGFVDGHYQYGSPVSAGQVIYDAAKAHGINPEVLLTKLQNEEMLVDGSTPSGYSHGCNTWQYASAMGYACTDSDSYSHTYTYTGNDPYSSGVASTYSLNDTSDLVTPLYYINGSPVISISSSCVHSNFFAGFSEQVAHTAWFLSYSRHKSEGQVNWAAINGNWDHCDDNDTCPASMNIPASYACYPYLMTQGTFERCPTDSSGVYYDGYTTIDGTSVHMDTGATAALYSYTPHFQSFDSIFAPWFGPTDVQYSWSLQSVSYSSGTNSFGAGMAGAVTVKVTNTGSVPWYNYGANPVRLGTWLPGRTSPLYSPGWVAPDRPANMVENQVAPGGTATFIVPINVNNVGSYVDAWNLVVENSQWMAWPGLSPTINIVNPYQWQVSSVTYSNGTGLMAPGTAQTITVKALNTGLATWTNSGGPPIKLGTWPAGRSSSVADGWPSSIRAATMQESSVAPGQTGTFQFSVRVPGSGLYYERMNLVAEGQAWFNDTGLTLYLQGGNYSWKPLWSSYSTGGNANLPRGTTMTVMVKALNTGNLAWTNTGSNTSWPIRFATDNPENRGSFLYDPSWINDTRPAALQESVVQPGQQGTFIFTAHIPSNAPLGPHYEYFNMIAEGILWFSDPDFYLYLNVGP